MAPPTADRVDADAGVGRFGVAIYTLMQSSRIRGTAGEPLPVVFRSLENSGTRFLRSQLVLIAAGPGTGKSAFALTLALLSRVPTLYFSADSDAFTQLVRSVSILTGMTLDIAAKAVRDNALSEIRGRLGEVPIRFSYDPAPSLEVIETQVEAYEEVYGEYPALVIVDNVTNVQTEGGDGDPFSGLEGLMDYLHTMARYTEACVVGLHHVTGEYNNTDKPIPLSGVKGQIGRVPEMVLTLHKPTPDRMGVSKVKDRSGKADATGQTVVELLFDGASMSIKDMDHFTATPDDVDLWTPTAVQPF